MLDLSLENRTAVVTGGGRGLGKAIADELASAGARVVLASRNEDQLREAVADIESRGGAGLAVGCDVSEYGQVERLMERAVAEFGGIDILVNNAGAAPLLVSMAKPRGMAKFEEYLHLNFIGAVYCTRAAAPHLLAKPGSSVLNMSSISGMTAQKGLSYYGAAKAAMNAFTRTVALEWAPAGVRVNALAPGIIRTDMYSRLLGVMSFERMARDIPMGRVGEVEEVAGAALFLCSPAASFITGAVLVIDGGHTLAVVREP